MMDGVEDASRGQVPRREEMQTPDEVAAMLRLKSLGWGIRRIAKELGCSHMTVRRYVAAGGWVAYRGRGRPRLWLVMRNGSRIASDGMPATRMSCGRSSSERRASA